MDSSTLDFVLVSEFRLEQSLSSPRRRISIFIWWFPFVISRAIFNHHSFYTL